jgi:hypothetical protein
LNIAWPLSALNGNAPTLAAKDAAAVTLSHAEIFA